MSPEEHRRRDDARFDVIAANLNSLVAVVEHEEKTSLEWRTRLCGKMDTLLDKMIAMQTHFDTLPCAARFEVTKALRSDVTWLQRIGGWALAIVITSLFGMGIAWGTLGKTVQETTDDVQTLQDEYHRVHVAVPGGVKP